MRDPIWWSCTAGLTASALACRSTSSRPGAAAGWVNSQVFDHTSVIRFLERRFGVIEPNISPWRRVVCGDLTSAFDFARPNAALPSGIPDPRPDAARAAAIKNRSSPTAPTNPELRWQEPGTRPSRPLPYRLDVTEARGQDELRLTFHTGGAGAVFHVYNRLALDSIPRRYTVEAGKQLIGTWPTEGPAGAYDLWILGPNGFHRHLAGSAQDQAIAAGLSWTFDRGWRRLRFETARGNDLIVSPNAYRGHHHPWHSSAGQRDHVWQLEPTMGWYDLSVTSAAAPAFVRRIAGRLETGRASCSDPALTGEPDTAAMSGCASGSDAPAGHSRAGVGQEAGRQPAVSRLTTWSSSRRRPCAAVSCGASP